LGHAVGFPNEKVALAQVAVIVPFAVPILTAGLGKRFAAVDHFIS
jgi:hypothetical protein